MTYQVTIEYGTHSAYYGNGGTTLAAAQAHLATMETFYTDLEYPITASSLTIFCPDCTTGRVRRCPSPKKHRNGYHGERCYKICPTCRGHFETRIQ